MAQITKPIALDETLQRVATACEGIKAVLAQTGEKIVLKITANGTSFPTEGVEIIVRHADDDSEIFRDDVPIGVEYTLSESIEPETQYYIYYENIEGWHKPNKEIHTAVHGFVRNITTSYSKFQIGAFIETIDHRLIPAEDWHDGVGIANAVYFSNGVNSFLIALTTIGTKAWALNSTDERNNYLPTDGSRIRTSTWMGGKDDCDYYIENQNLDNMPALKSVREYVWETGGHDINAYLPSIGELELAAANIDSINACLTAVGKYEWNIMSANYWSSSQSSLKTASWITNKGVGSVGADNKTAAYNVRAFSVYYNS